MYLKGITGLQYSLADSPFTSGGEGQIYEVIGDSSIVAKLYKDSIQKDEKEKKLVVMAQRPPNQDIIRFVSWPKDLLYDNGFFKGFIMNRIDASKNLNVVYEYGPKSQYKDLSWFNKITVAYNLCTLVEGIHKVKHVCGDFNPNNICVNVSTGTVSIIDTDSFHITDKGNVYRCNVGMTQYLPVEIQKKMQIGLSKVPLPTFTEETDNFALAVHIFQILMNGVHPFASRVTSSCQESVANPMTDRRIVDGETPFFKNIKNFDIPLIAPPINIFPENIQLLFKRAFVDGYQNPRSRPTAIEWKVALLDLRNNLKSCDSVNCHNYYKKLNSCPWCKLEHTYESLFNESFGRRAVPSQNSDNKQDYTSPASAPKRSQKTGGLASKWMSALGLNSSNKQSQQSTNGNSTSNAPQSNQQNSTGTNGKYAWLISAWVDLYSSTKEIHYCQDEYNDSTYQQVYLAYINNTNAIEISFGSKKIGVYPDRIEVTGGLFKKTVSTINCNHEVFRLTTRNRHSAKLLGIHWLHERLDGGPDGRFSTNYQFYTYQLGRFIMFIDGVRYVFVTPQLTLINKFNK